MKLKIFEISGPDSSIPYPINGDGGRERVIEWISKDLGTKEKVYLVAQVNSQLDNVNILEVKHTNGLNVHEFYKNFSSLYPFKLECDILHVHHPEYLLFSNHINAKKIILTHHGYYSEMVKYRTKYSFEETFVSRHLKELMLKKNGYVIYNPIPIKEYPFLRKKKDARDLLFIGTCDKKVKRLDIALEVARRVQCKLIIAGKASVSLKKKLKEISYVDYVGEIDQNKKIALMSEMKGVICPSDSPEAFCLVVAEANALGIPVLGSNNGGVPEVIEHNIGGYICLTINDYVDGFYKLDKLDSKKIRESIMKRFDISIISSNYLNLFKSLIKEKNEI